MSNKYLDFALKEIVNHEVNDVLDKIRAEIEAIETYDGLYIDRAYVLQIIDKYRESKDTE